MFFCQLTFCLICGCKVIKEGVSAVLLGIQNGGRGESNKCQTSNIKNIVFPAISKPHKFFFFISLAPLSKQRLRLSKPFTTRFPSAQPDSDASELQAGGSRLWPFVYEILRLGDCICGSWLEQRSEWGAGMGMGIEVGWVGNGKQTPERSGACTHVPRLFTLRLGRYTPMHSSAHGGLTRSGSVIPRLT